MNYNYHTHTIRCHHATGKPEEYVLRAIENNVKYMGFSDHIPFCFPDGYESHFRVSVNEVEEYIAELEELRNKYCDRIDIKIGFEMEYYPKYFGEMYKNAVKWGAEYLILGQHFIGNEYPGGIWTGGKNQSKEDLHEYTQCVVSAMETGVFTYVAHPDLFRFTGKIDEYRGEIIEICKASKKYNIPLEINFYGIRDNRFYPYDKFWEVAGQVGCPVTFGFDSHDVLSAFDGESLERAEQLVEKYKLNYIGKPEIKSIEKGYINGN